MLPFSLHRPILSQVKQKTPIILPSFEVVSVPDELSGQYSVSCFRFTVVISATFTIVSALNVVICG